MSKPSKSFFSGLKSSMVKRSPDILLGTGIAGMIITTIVAVKATPKAMALVEEEKLRRYKEIEDDTITKVDIVKTCWKCYVPAVILAAVSTACLIGSRSVGARRMAALTAAYQISETALTEYRDKVVETIGEKKEKQVREKVAEEQLKTHPVSERKVINTGRGNTLCYDPLSDRYFRSDLEVIRRAENSLNRELIHGIGSSITLNEFYDAIDLHHTELGDGVGWCSDYLISLDITSHITDDDEPAAVINHYNPPRYERY